MSAYADLEISLFRHDINTYSVEFRFSLPESDVDIRPGSDKPVLARFDLDALQLLAYDPDAYGQALTASLFADTAVQSAFAQARAGAQSKGVGLRLRLLVGPSAPELHRLRWETLRDPQDGTPLFMGENLLFSRYLFSQSWREVRLRPKGELSALLAVANPNNLGEYDLAPVDVPAEVERARLNLGQIPVAVLPDRTSDTPVTLDNLLARVRAGVDILYLVCHGSLKDGEPWLWLENDQGQAARVSGEELVQRMRELEQQPRLVVLVSCQSAGEGVNDVLSAVGPGLAQAGIPAVIAMQGNLSMETAAKFMPVFFQELQRDGFIDRAMSVARGTVRQRPDAWMPALFMRLKSGRIWYVPGFGMERRGIENTWRLFLSKIDDQVCTPILGPGLNDYLLDPQVNIARRWAEAYHYPMEPHERESLPQVAQYLAVDVYDRAPYDELANYLKQVIRSRYAEILPNELQQRKAHLDDLIMAIGAHRRQTDPADPYRLLAELDLPVYITTNYDNLLAAALQEAGKDPQVMVCPWNDQLERVQSIYDQERDFHPTPERPLVFHLFGRLNEPRSVVLTEDDYFKFLIGVTRNSSLIPSDVLGALVDSALLLLGFRMEDWQFRVLFHSLLDQQGNILRGAHPHIAAQIEPEEGRILDPERARDYLNKYYGGSQEGAKIKFSIYWGNVDDFIRDLIQQRQAQSVF